MALEDNFKEIFCLKAGERGAKIHALQVPSDFSGSSEIQYVVYCGLWNPNLKKHCKYGYCPLSQPEQTELRPAS